MKHYICVGGCGAESDAPGVCYAEGCSYEGKQYVECNCSDGTHKQD